MKKVIAIFAIATTLVACGGNASTEATATDTAVDPDVDPIRMRDIGSVGLKFLVLWRNAMGKCGSNSCICTNN